MQAKVKLALSRLRKWSDPQASGSPTQRMVAIWPKPIEMARDIHVLLEIIDAADQN